MFINFTNLNVVCPKDPYPLSNLNRLLYGSSGYKSLSFMVAYSGYNQIMMDRMDAPRATFMSNHGNYYHIIPFRLKNADTTYQRVIDIVFS